MVGGLVVVFLVKRFAPEAKGHGVPEVMDAIFYKRGKIRGTVALIKALASAVSIGSGAAVGREGPIIQIGSALGSAFAQFIGLSTRQRITLLSAGAGACSTPPVGAAAASETMQLGYHYHHRKVCTVRTIVKRGYYGRRLVKHVRVCRCR